MKRGGILDEIVMSRGRVGVAVPDAPLAPECKALGFSMRNFKAQRIGAFHSVGDIAQMGLAWQYLYRVWLASGPFEPVDTCRRWSCLSSFRRR